MYIRYFIPEDGDDEKHPNVFKVDKDSNLTLADIKKAFPIPGTYHFRFLRSLESMVVWMDIVDESSAAPIYNNCITIKVSRMETGGSSRPQQVRSVTEKVAPSLKKEEKRPSVGLIHFEDADQPSKSVPQVQYIAATPSGEEDLLGFASSEAASSSNAPAPDPFGFSDFSAPPARALSPMNPAPISASNGMGSRGQNSPVGAPMNTGRSAPMGGMGGQMNGSRGVGGPMGGGRGMGMGASSMPYPSQLNQQKQQQSNQARKDSIGIDAFSGFK